MLFTELCSNSIRNVFMIRISFTARFFSVSVVFHLHPAAACEFLRFIYFSVIDESVKSEQIYFLKSVLTWIINISGTWRQTFILNGHSGAFIIASSLYIFSGSPLIAAPLQRCCLKKKLVTSKVQPSPPEEHAASFIPPFFRLSVGKQIRGR